MPDRSEKWHLIPLGRSSDTTPWVIPLLGKLRDLFHPEGCHQGLSTWITPQLCQCFRATMRPLWELPLPGMTPPGVPLSQPCSKEEPEAPRMTHIGVPPGYPCSKEHPEAPKVTPPSVALSQPCPKEEPEPPRMTPRCPSRLALLQSASWSSQGDTSRCPSEPTPLQGAAWTPPRQRGQVEFTKRVRSNSRH